eukprot:s117_g35.t1
MGMANLGARWGLKPPKGACNVIKPSKPAKGSGRRKASVNPASSQARQTAAGSGQPAVACKDASEKLAESVDRDWRLVGLAADSSTEHLAAHQGTDACSSCARCRQVLKVGQ